MTNWTNEQLDVLGGAGEVDIAPRRDDGTASRSTTIWIVRVGDDLYVRSYRGTSGSWYRTATRTKRGRVHVGGHRYDANFEPATDAHRQDVDAAYRAKYGRSSYVDAMVSDAAAATTLHLLPASERHENN
jgi:hypothetical protein